MQTTECDTGYCRSPVSCNQPELAQRCCRSNARRCRRSQFAPADLAIRNDLEKYVGILTRTAG